MLLEKHEYMSRSGIYALGNNVAMQKLTQLCTARSVGRKPTFVSYIPDGSDLQPMASLRRMKRWPFYGLWIYCQRVGKESLNN